ncbi:MAG: hypothetical protein AVDCRST_MAG78-3114 [uncultured Rubrobacteraceae bacterium]|uniref:DUF1186 domain-containing protein n=1 Tax=uncultured Rubrobacteraceae bacterium TaxID=349277 RepID=A0A6J4QUV9_9ACTN|nr:MAG: hypothetical protein AVDCRST_MAG78-3114 [uncultured Rubrobacteraceae bacterium]
MSTDYSFPVSELLTFGDCREFRGWPDYPDLVGLGPEHVSELIRMVTDEDLNWADPESLEVWAPVHAWRALGQLQATTASEPLLELFQEVEEGNDWAGDELPEVYGLIGRAAIPALERYLADTSRELWARVTAAYSLERIAARDPSARIKCVAVLSRQLEKFPQSDPTLNGFLINYLIDLGAVGMAPLMEQAFAADSVDLSIQGDWEDVQVELGLKTSRETPRPYYFALDPPTSDEPGLYAPEASNSDKVARKAKRKQSRASRKKNRKQR